jgi:hypothetical protein
MRQPTLLGAVAAAKPRRAGGRVFGNCGPANPTPVPANCDDQVNAIDALFVLAHTVASSSVDREGTPSTRSSQGALRSVRVYLIDGTYELFRY